MGEFYDGPSNESKSDDNELSDTGRYFLYRPDLGSVTDCSPASNIIVGIFTILMGVFCICLVANSITPISFKITIISLLSIIFGAISMGLIGIGIDRIRKTKEEINKAIEENKDTLNDFCKSIDTSKKGRVLTEEKELKPNKVKTRVIRIFGYVFIFLGILFMFLLKQDRALAEITSITNNTETVSYTFTYTYKGDIYQGKGEDDIKFYDTLSTTGAHIIYVKEINPADYSFNQDPANVILLVLFEIIGGALLIYGIVTRRKYLVSIKFVGDLNKDGKIDEKDYEIYKINEAIGVKIDVTGKKNYKFCPYCGENLVSIYNCVACGKKIE